MTTVGLLGDGGEWSGRGVEWEGRREKWVGEKERQVGEKERQTLSSTPLATTTTTSGCLLSSPPPLMRHSHHHITASLDASSSYRHRDITIYSGASISSTHLSGTLVTSTHLLTNAEAMRYSCNNAVSDDDLWILRRF
ncbi:hypothetical protein Pcinc_041364 [Petrolisthes cinctipes]|uniref:Uncharacterized protein n=1 Tax=Petrolisthes cinctipes TaxID=88211 RepID=A0AAE1BNC2_PETCI|nr:hypothetical protein Pcinc_041364 [Petrolisthes cinctipes]